jgi:trimeric autotransporter adhesin
MAIFTGTAGNDNFTGTDENDLFRLFQGGDDVALGGDGNDVFRMEGALTAADSLRGGGGNNKVVLKGDYSGANAVVFGADTIRNISQLTLGGGFDYTLTLHDGNVGSGSELTIKAAKLDATQELIFDGSAETNGFFNMRTGAGNDSVTGGAQGDYFLLSKGGNDSINGGGGGDTFILGQRFNNSDSINGGGGDDTMVLNGDYTLFFQPTAISSLETISIVGDHNYLLDFNNSDAYIAAGKTMTIDASSLGAFNTTQVFFIAETDGHVVFLGGSGNDSIGAGSGSDQLFGFEGDDSLSGNGGNDEIQGGNGTNTIAGSGGQDVMSGGTGVDTYTFAQITDSVGVNCDHITNFDFDADKMQVLSLINSVGTVAGSLSSATFDDDMAAAVNAAALPNFRAVLFTANGGDLSGNSYVVVSIDGTAGYQSGDFVIEVTGFTGTLSTDDFV